MAFGNPQLGEPITLTAGGVLLAASKAKGYYESFKNQFGLDSSMNKMAVVNRIGRTTVKTKMCRQANLLCLSQFNIYPGEKLQVLAQSQNWAYVVNSNGVAGYVPLTDIRISWTEIANPDLEENDFRQGSSPTGQRFFDDVQVKPPPPAPEAAPSKLGVGALAAAAVAAFLLLK